MNVIAPECYKDSTIVFRPVDIFNALKSTKTGKACEGDRLAAEHFIHATLIIHVYLPFAI